MEKNLKKMEGMRKTGTEAGIDPQIFAKAEGEKV
jgi:hypothetical protein